MPTTAVSSVNVLIVDDHENMRRILGAILRGFGFLNLREAGNGREALDALRSFQPDIIVTDLSMPLMDGIALVKELRRLSDPRLSTTPVVMVSGHAHAAHVLAARDAGVSEFISKPVPGANLADRIRRIVECERPFVRTPGYLGPCRRRNDQNRSGLWRRADDPPREAEA